MKRCPECRRDFYDDSLIFCLDDGTRLLDGPPSVDEPATALLHSTAPPAEAATRAQIDITNPTAVLSTSKKFDKRILALPLLALLLITIECRRECDPSMMFVSTENHMFSADRTAEPEGH